MEPAFQELNANDDLLCENIMLELDIDFDNPDPETIELLEAGGVCYFLGYLARKVQKKLGTLMTVPLRMPGGEH